MTRGEFGRITLSGRRFKAPGMPVEALAEVVSYRALLFQMARAVHFQNKPNATRSPQGLESSLGLRIRKFRRGSSIAVLERRVSAEGFAAISKDIPEDKMGPLLAHSRQAIEDTIRAVEHDERPPFEVTAELAKAFARLGATLLPKERLWLSPPGKKARRTEVTKAVREKFQELAQRPALSAIATEYGYIFKIDTETQTCVLQGAQRQIECKYEIGAARKVREHLAKEETQLPRIALTGLATRRLNGSVEQFKSITAIRIAGEQAKERNMAKLGQLTALAPGWNGPGTLPPSEQAINNYRSLLTAVGTQDVTVDLEPVALEDGGIRLEWQRADADYIAEIETGGGMYLCILRPDASEDDDRELERFDPMALARFFKSGSFE